MAYLTVAAGYFTLPKHYPSKLFRNYTETQHYVSVTTCYCSGPKLYRKVTLLSHCSMENHTAKPSRYVITADRTIPMRYSEYTTNAKVFLTYVFLESMKEKTADFLYHQQNMRRRIRIPFALQSKFLSWSQ